VTEKKEVSTEEGVEPNVEGGGVGGGGGGGGGKFNREVHSYWDRASRGGGEKKKKNSSEVVLQGT